MDETQKYQKEAELSGRVAEKEKGLGLSQ